MCGGTAVAGAAVPARCSPPRRRPGRTRCLAQDVDLPGVVAVKGEEGFEELRQQDSHEEDHGEPGANSRARLLRARIASLRASIARQRREIDVLTNELNACPGSQGCEVSYDSLFDRLYRSVNVLMGRVTKCGDPLSFVYDQTGTALRLAQETAATGELVRDVLPNAPMLLTHVPGIYARATQLDSYVHSILPVLDGYLPLVEPHLDTLIERFDDIEPHLPYCLDNVDIIVPHLEDILEYLDYILLFAAEARVWGEIEPWLPLLVPKIKTLGPRLPLLYPHLYVLRPHFRKLARHVDRLTLYPEVCSYADILLLWFGWLLWVPLADYLFRVPGIPKLLSWVAPRLPQRAPWRRHRAGWRERRRKQRQLQWKRLQQQQLLLAQQQQKEQPGAQQELEDGRQEEQPEAQQELEDGWQEFLTRATAALQSPPDDAQGEGDSTAGGVKLAARTVECQPVRPARRPVAHRLAHGPSLAAAAFYVLNALQDARDEEDCRRRH